MKINLFLILTLLTSFAWGQDLPESLTLDEAITFGLKNNSAIINADLEIQKAYKEKWKTIAIGLPQISAEANYQNFLERPVSLVPAEFFGGIPGEFSELTFGTKQNLIGTVKLEQLIFDGSYLVGLEAIKVYLNISENLFKKTTLEVKKLTVTTYTSVLLAEYNVNFLEKNIAKLEDNLTEVHQLFKNGFEEEESVEQIHLTLSNINSQLKYAKNFIKITEEILKFVIGYPLDQKLVLSSGVEDIFSEASLLIDKPDAVDIINNIDIQIAENKMKSDALLFKLEKSKSLPKLMAFINGTYTGNSNEFTFTENSQKWFGSSLVGVKLNIPIFSSLGRSANTQKAKITLEQAKTNLNEVQNRVQIEVNAALNDYQLAIENYFTEKENLRLAERIEKKNQTKYFEGMVSSFELRQAQLQLYTIQSSFLNSINNVITKKIELETLLNTPNP